MNFKRFTCLDDLARDNEYKRLDEGVVALLARLGPLERLDEFKLLDDDECLDEFETSRWSQTFDELDKGVVALLVCLGPLERDNDSEHRRLDSSRAWQHSWYVSIVLMASAVWYSFFDLLFPNSFFERLCRLEQLCLAV